MKNLDVAFSVGVKILFYSNKLISISVLVSYLYKIRNWNVALVYTTLNIY